MYGDFAVNKYLRTVASGWIFINIEDSSLLKSNAVPAAKYLQSTWSNIPEESNVGGTIFLGRFAKLQKATIILHRPLRFLNRTL